MPDLITTDFATSVAQPSATQLPNLAATVKAASRLARTHTGRYLSRRPDAGATLGPVDELITPEPRAPIVLREYPVNEVLRVSSTPLPILTVRSASDAAQRATVRLTATGDDLAGFTTTGLLLTRTTSGVKTETAVPFSGLATPTIDDLAAAVRAADPGGGWEADVLDGFGQWGVDEIRAGQGTRPARGDGAGLLAWTEDIPFERDDRAGILVLGDGAQSDPFHSPKWGTRGLDFDDPSIRSEYQSLRVIYDAGYDPVPEDLQQAVAELVKAMLERNSINSVVATERIEAWSVTMRDFVDSMPVPVRNVFAYYRSHYR